MSAATVLDVGCGTGALLRRARREGQTGRLCGLDPAVGMLDQARSRSDIAAIRSALTDDGRFAFETRNPLARAWEDWTPANAVEVTDAAGVVVRMTHEVEAPVEPGIIHLATTFSSPGWEGPQVSHSILRFLDVVSLSRYVVGAGLLIEAQLGNWSGEPFTQASPEIITIARRA